MENSIKSSSINYGLYLGGLLALITVAIWFIDIGLMVNMWIGLSLILIMIVFGVVSTAKSKDIHKGFLTFKQAFSSYFITVAVGIIISTIVSAILFNFIDPDAALQIKEMTIETSIKFMEGMGAPPDTIAEAVDKMESQNQFGLFSILKQVFWNILLFGCLIGLIVAAIMKRSNPDA